MNGAEAICHILEDEGVKYVFGVPGSTEIPILDALTQTAEIKYISAVHEAVSMGMADGYARASGKAGVVLVHTAPGTSFGTFGQGEDIHARRLCHWCKAH